MTTATHNPPLTFDADASCIEPTGDVFVVVPSYNHARFVATCLRSIFKQTLAPAKLLVIDDGSIDDSPRVIADALKECPFPCELIARENRGLCVTLNEGLAHSSSNGGRYFAYLGSDDLWLENFLEARVKLLAARPRAVLAYGHAYLLDEHNRIIDCTRDWAHYADGDARPMLWHTVTAPMSPSVLYRRAALARHGGWDESARLEDYDLYLRLGAAGGEFAFDPRVLSAWRWHGTNTSRDQLMMLEEQLAAQRRAAKLFDISAGELDRRHAAIRFRRAEDFLRLGHKRPALALLRRNWRGAAATTSTTLLPTLLARMTLRLLTPFSLAQWHRRRVARRAGERYGTLQL